MTENDFQDVVTVGKDIGTHVDGLADHPPDGEAALVHRGRDGLDDHAPVRSRRRVAARRFLPLVT